MITRELLQKELNKNPYFTNNIVTGFRVHSKTVNVSSTDGLVTYFHGFMIRQLLNLPELPEPKKKPMHQTKL